MEQLAFKPKIFGKVFLAHSQGYWHPKAEDWPTEFGLPVGLGTVLLDGYKLRDPSMNKHLLEIYKHVPDEADVTPALHAYWAWRLGRGKHGALTMLNGAGRNPGISPGLRQAIRFIRGNHESVAKGEDIFPADSWLKKYDKHWFTYGGPVNAPQPHLAAYLLRSSIQMNFSYEHPHAGKLVSLICQMYG